MRKFYFIAAFFSLCFLQNNLTLASDAKDSLSVNISIDNQSSNDDFRKESRSFLINAAVKNTSDHDITLVIWTAAGWSWVSDNPNIIPYIDAKSNLARPERLKPQQVFSFGVPMTYTSQLPQTFRLGFVPRSGLPASTSGHPLDEWGGVFWSNQVTLKN